MNLLDGIDFRCWLQVMAFPLLIFGIKVLIVAVAARSVAKAAAEVYERAEGDRHHHHHYPQAAKFQ